MKERRRGLETKVATGRKMVRGKKFFMVREKSENFTWVRENLNLWKRSGKREVLRVNIYFFPLLLLFSNIFNSFVHFTDMNHVVLVDCCSLNWTTSFVKELSIHAPCTWLCVNKWVERMVLREVLSALGKFYICQGKVRDFQNPPTVAIMTALPVLFFHQ